MQYFTSAASLTRTILASTLVASGIGAATPGEAGPTDEGQGLVPVTYEEQVSVLSSGPARRESVVSPPVATSALTVELGAAVVHAETQTQVDQAAWAIGRFAEAGLDLPPLTVHLHSDRVQCNGLNGYLAHAAGGEFVIHSCGVDFTLLHEMAHAWDLYSLNETTRDAFLETAHADVWSNPDNWYLAGGEHAANVVAWALMETRINQTRTRPNDIKSMYDGYDLLTGGGIPLWSAASESTDVSAVDAPVVPAADRGAGESSRVGVSGATPAEAERVRWAVQRFEVAGLELPPLTVFHHDDKEGCGGFVGYYSESEQRVDVCTRAETSSRRRTVLHELGHAWSFTHMTDREIDEFVAYRGLTVWKGTDAPWWQMGQEQAAEIVAWGIQDVDEYQSIWLHMETCSDLAASFELLTGIPPLHNNAQYCK